MTETTDMDARRIVDLTVTELRELIRAELTSTIEDLFAAVLVCADTTTAEQLLRFRTLRANRAIGGAAGSADHWTLNAMHVERSLAERLRAVNAPAASVDIVRALGECSDDALAEFLGQDCSGQELAGIRAAVRMRLGVSDEGLQQPAAAELVFTVVSDISQLRGCPDLLDIVAAQCRTTLRFDTPRTLRTTSGRPAALRDMPHVGKRLPPEEA